MEAGYGSLAYFWAVSRGEPLDDVGVDGRAGSDEVEAMWCNGLEGRRRVRGNV